MPGVDWRDPGELTLDEGRKLIDDVAAMGTPLIVFTGGDPLQRDDLEDLIRHACSRKLTVGTIPAELQPDVSFAGALTSTARQPEAASALIRFLASPEAATTILKAGLTPVSGR